MKELIVKIQDKVQLYQCYMPFVDGGGLFIPYDGQMAIGESIDVQLALLDANYRFNGIVIWKTPQAAVGRLRPAGVGVQVPEKSHAIVEEIETMLVAFSTDGIERFTF